MVDKKNANTTDLPDYEDYVLEPEDNDAIGNGNGTGAAKPMTYTSPNYNKPSLIAVLSTPPMCSRDASQKPSSVSTSYVRPCPAWERQLSSC
jgi:hypothetical protein